MIILSLCTDTGSACYDCFATFPEGMSISKKYLTFFHKRYIIQVTEKYKIGHLEGCNVYFYSRKKK